MGRAAKILLGSVATALLTVGVAAQTGTVNWPAVKAQEGIASPSIATSPAPSSSPAQR